MKTLLGKKTNLWKFKVAMLSPLWFINNSPNRKPYDEFKHGLIDHDHEYDYSKLTGSKESGHYYPCKHYGCNIVSVQDENGKWLDV